MNTQVVHAKAQENIFSELIEKVASEVKRLYVGQLPYHNWEHATTVTERAMKLADLCESYRINVRRESLMCAALTHDLLFLVPADLLGHESKEELAGTVACKLLEKLKAPAWFAQEVRDIVIATHVTTPPKSIEQKIIRAADLGDVGGEYEVFFKNSQSLFEEAKLLNNPNLTFENWVPGSMNFLAKYIWPFIQLTPYAYNERNASAWHTRAISNIARLMIENHPKNEKLIISGLMGEGVEEHLSSYKVIDPELIIAIDPRDNMREKLLTQGQQVLKEKGGKKVLLYAPGSLAAAPLSDGMCDIITANLTKPRDAGALSEIKRSLKVSGIANVFLSRGAQIELSDFAQIAFESGFEILQHGQYKEGVDRIVLQKRS